MPLDLLPDPDPAIDELARDLDLAREPSYPLTFVVRRLIDPAPAIPSGESSGTGESDAQRLPSGTGESDAQRLPSLTLDALAEESGYRGLGAGWVEIPRRIAAKILLHIISGELAYPEEVVPRERAEALGSRFLDLFAGARYFTNGAVSGDFAIYDRDGAEVLGWRSLSEAPFDNGVVALGGGRVGLLWAEDAP